MYPLGISRHLEVLLTGPADKVGQEFLQDLVLELSKVLSSDYTFIGELIKPGSDRIRSIAFCAQVKLAENFEYDLKATPCENVIGQSLCCHVSGVAQMFPDDAMLADLSIEGYVGVPLFDAEGKAFGIMVALFTQPVPEPETAGLLLNLFACRVSNELNRIKIQQAVEEQRVRSQKLLQGIPDLIFHVDREGRICDFHASDDSDLAAPKEQVIGLYIRDIQFDPSIKVNMSECLQRCLETGKMQTVEYALKLAKGREFFEGRFVQIDEDHVSIVARNITSQKLLEEERNRLQMRLNQAEKIQSIGQLAGGIAHDFNNQLTGIIGYTELLCMETSDQPRLHSFAEHILSAAKNAGELTAQLLAFARKGKVMTTEVDMHSLIDEVIRLLSRSIDKRIEINAQLDAAKFHVVGDASQLQNVLLNLGLNSRDAMPDGGRLIFKSGNVHSDRIDEWVKRSSDLEPGDYLLLQVIDTGMGIDPEILDQIFEPFFTTKPEGMGTGMGLAASYGTIKNHYGAILVQSNPGVETIFSIYLPSQTYADDPINEGIETDGCQTGFRQCHLMVVDDESIICSMLDRLISRMGHRVTTFTSALAALEFFRTQGETIDLVVLDMMMPEMIGTDLLRKLRGIDSRVRAIISSGHIWKEDQSLSDIEGIEAFIPKPYRVREFQDLLERTLSRGCDDD